MDNSSMVNDELCCIQYHNVSIITDTKHKAYLYIYTHAFKSTGLIET